jgi:transposase
MSAQQMRWLAQTVKDHTPLRLICARGLWTLSLIAALIEREFATKLSLASVSRIMKWLGFSARKSLYQAWQQDATLVRTREAEIYPAIRTEAKAKGAAICFADEARIRSDCDAGTTWASVGETPVLEVTGARLSVNMISAVSPVGDFRCMLHDGLASAKAFRQLLERQLIGVDQPIFLIVDGHPLHKARLVKEFVHTQEGKPKPFHLPSCSPDLHPDEQVWAYVTREVARQLVQTKDEMKRLAHGALP